MPNQVLAELYKTAAILSKEENQLNDALAYFTRAKQLYEKVGVKKLITEVEKLITEQKSEENQD